MGVVECGFPDVVVNVDSLAIVHDVASRDLGVVVEDFQPFYCLVNFVASPNVSPDSNVGVSDGEVAPLVTGDRGFISPAGGILPVDNAHLACNLRDHEVMHGDWLDGGISSSGGEEINEKGLASFFGLFRVVLSVLWMGCFGGTTGLILLGFGELCSGIGFGQ